MDKYEQWKARKGLNTWVDDPVAKYLLTVVTVLVWLFQLAVVYWIFAMLGSLFSSLFGSLFAR